MDIWFFFPDFDLPPPFGIVCACIKMRVVCNQYQSCPKMLPRRKTQKIDGKSRQKRIYSWAPATRHYPLTPSFWLLLSLFPFVLSCTLVACSGNFRKDSTSAHVLRTGYSNESQILKSRSVSITPQLKYSPSTRQKTFLAHFCKFLETKSLLNLC